MLLLLKKVFVVNDYITMVPVELFGYLQIAMVNDDVTLEFNCKALVHFLK